MIRTFRSALFAATALSVVAPIVAVAQDESAGVEQIVVTARRIQENLQDVPMSISVLSQSQLSDRNIVTAGDLATYVPALSVNSEFGADATSFIIRGFSQDIGTSPTVGTYFDDVVSPRGGFGGATIHAGEGAGPGAFFDLQNVQVLKGPQGTLFGRNTTGGSILLVPQKPTDEFGGYLEASAGDFGMERFQAVVNIPISDHLRFRIGFDQETRDGYIKNISGIGPGSMNNINYGTVRASVDWDVTSQIENYTVAWYTDSDNHGTDTQIVACNPAEGLGFFACNQLASEGTARGPYTVDNSVFNARSYLQEWQVINTTTWNFAGNASFKNIASYSQIQAINNSSLFGDDFKLFPGAPPLFFTAEDTPPHTLLTDQQSFSEEPRFAGTAFDGKMQWQAGLYFEASEPLGIAGSSGPNAIACTNFQQLQCTDYLGGVFPTINTYVGTVGRRTGNISWRDYGAYAQDTFDITDRLSLTTGVRFSQDLTKSNTDRISYYFPAPNTPAQICEPPIAPYGNCDVALRQNSSAPTGEVNLSYKITDDVMAYAQYARGYRQGGLLSTGPIGYSTFQPEHLNAYETGVKATLEGPVAGFVDAAFFYNDFADQQILGTFVGALGTPPNAGILNAGASRIWGFDLDSTLVLMQDLTVNFGYTYLNSLLESVKPETVSGNYTTFGPNELPGSPLALTPENKLSLTPTYRLPLDESVGKLSVGMTWTYTSRELVYGVGPYAHIPATNLFNANVNWESLFGKPVDAEFFMTNVTNQHYPTYIDNFSNPVGGPFAQYGLVAESFGPPRMYGFRLRYHF